jgi:hypothetical protein
MSIPETIAQNLELAVLAGIILRAILAWQTELSWYEYRTLHGLKRLVAQLYPSDTIGPVSLVNRKGGRDDAEYLGYSEASPREVMRELRSEGFALHLLASLKVRPMSHPTYAQLVMTHDNGMQTECYLFSAEDGTDVYAHFERSAGSIRHLTDTDQVDGDPREVVPEGIYA